MQHQAQIHCSAPWGTALGAAFLWLPEALQRGMWVAGPEPGDGDTFCLGLPIWLLLRCQPKPPVLLTATVALGWLQQTGNWAELRVLCGALGRQTWGRC